MGLAAYFKRAISPPNRRREVAIDVTQEQTVKRRFANRLEAGRKLATHLSAYVESPNLLVLALPRGGVPIAYEVAHALHARLDVFIVRKLGVPWNEELAMGAIATGGVRVLNQEISSAAIFPTGLLMTSPSESKKSWNAGNAFTEVTGRRPISGIARSF